MPAGRGESDRIDTMSTTTTNRAARRRPSLRLSLLAATAGAALASAPARAAIEENYASGEPPITTTWYTPVSEAAQRADRDYVAGMRPHHAGALSMSREYLSDPGRSSPLLQALSRAIVANQTFEIGVLDEVGRNLDRPPVRLPFGLKLQPVATEGLTGAQRFFKEPIPSEAIYATGPVSERDVQFAKAMIIHHEGAVEMARAYHANADARNGFLGLMNVDITTDQTQEIALMRRIIAAYPGDAASVRVDPSMVHGMEGMKHGGGHGGHGGAHAASAAAGAGTAQPAGQGTAERPRRHGDHAAHGHHGAHGGSAPAPEAARSPRSKQQAPRHRPAPQPPAADAGQGHQHHQHH
jgi:uncharacterized protein (DUF305 family)